MRVEVLDISSNTVTHNSSQNTPDGTSEGPAVDNNNGDDCVDLHQLEDYSFVQNHVTQKIYEATICSKAKSDVLPLFDYGIQIREDVNMTPYIYFEDTHISGLLFTQIQDDSVSYYSIDRNRVVNNEVNYYNLTGEVVITKEEIIEVIDGFECFIYCNFKDTEETLKSGGGDGGPIINWIIQLFNRIICPSAEGGGHISSPKTKWWEKLDLIHFERNNRPFSTSI